MIETTKGPLINALLKYDGIDIYPINPTALANYRKAFAHGGGKNDPSDAMLLAQYLQHYIDQLRSLRHDSSITRELDSLTRDRRHLVDQRTAHCNELKAVLKQYFSRSIEAQGSEDIRRILAQIHLEIPYADSGSSCCPHQPASASFMALARKQSVGDRVDTIMDAVPLTQDEVTLRSAARRVTALCRLIQTYNTQVDLYDKEIETLVVQHTDCELFASLPGASHKTQARMIAALGDDRARFPTAESIQTASGIAPLTTQSGKTKFVSCRWACSKFLRQTFHEYAGLSTFKSKWAAAFYKQQRDKGNSAQVAKRALAFKWQRIIHRCWQNREPYDEARYIERLRATGSPLIALIDNAPVENLSAETP